MSEDVSADSVWRELAANLSAGTRLALFMPVRAGEIKISGSNYTLLLAVWRGKVFLEPSIRAH